jgi:hypothetical protein
MNHRVALAPEEELKQALGVTTLLDFASVEAWARATDHPDDRAAAASLAAASTYSRGAMVTTSHCMCSFVSAETAMCWEEVID